MQPCYTYSSHSMDMSEVAGRSPLDLGDRNVMNRQFKNRGLAYEQNA